MKSRRVLLELAEVRIEKSVVSDFFFFFFFSKCLWGKFFREFWNVFDGLLDWVLVVKMKAL